MEVSGGLEFRIYYSSEQNLKSFRKSIMFLFFLGCPCSHSFNGPGGPKCRVRIQSFMYCSHI